MTVFYFRLTLVSHGCHNALKVIQQIDLANEDMVKCIILLFLYNSFISGAKEIDIAATVEHLRDQRPSMVKTKVRDIMFLCAICMSALCFFCHF